MIPVSIYAESTPNPNAMKFVADIMLASEPFEFVKSEYKGGSPLADELFKFPFVQNIFISSNFISINKTDNIEWYEILSELREFIQQYLREGKKIFAEKVEQEAATFSEPETPDEISEKIKFVLDEYVKPAVEGDGGAINFHSWKDGKVTVLLKGSCSGCPSSTLTLKAGIENLLKQMIPEVEEVVALNG